MKENMKSYRFEESIEISLDTKKNCIFELCLRLPLLYLRFCLESRSGFSNVDPDPDSKCGSGSEYKIMGKSEFD